MRVILNTSYAKAALSLWKPFAGLQSGIKVHIANTVHVGENGESISMIELVSFLMSGGVSQQGRPVPPRPFFSAYASENKEWLLDQVVKNITWHKRRTADTGHAKLWTTYCVLHTHTLAETVRTHFQQWLRSGSYFKRTAPNAPYTIARKGSDVPLVDTGQLVNSIIATPINGRRGGVDDSFVK